ncbi:MAG: type II toxin-antitoxin system HicB family antitoxin [Planctomycetota bacterium]
MLEHQGYLGRVEFDDEAGVFHGAVIGIRDVVTFEGTSVVELRQAFADSVDDYLAFCQERGESPDKPYSGKFVLRVPPDLHRKANMQATAAGKSLNAWIIDCLSQTVCGDASQAR